MVDCEGSFSVLHTSSYASSHNSIVFASCRKSENNSQFQKKIVRYYLIASYKMSSFLALHKSFLSSLDVEMNMDQRRDAYRQQVALIVNDPNIPDHNKSSTQPHLAQPTLLLFPTLSLFPVRSLFPEPSSRRDKSSSIIPPHKQEGWRRPGPFI